MNDQALFAIMAAIALVFGIQAAHNLAPLIWPPSGVQVVSLCADANVDTGCRPAEPLQEQAARP
jgi:hypothetical protein